MVFHCPPLPSGKYHNLFSRTPNMPQTSPVFFFWYALHAHPMFILLRVSTCLETLDIPFLPSRLLLLLCVRVSLLLELATSAKLLWKAFRSFLLKAYGRGCNSFFTAKQTTKNRNVLSLCNGIRYNFNCQFIA